MNVEEWSVPTSSPSNDAAMVWATQVLLLSEAQACFGQRDVTRTICQPDFHDAAPQLHNNVDEVRAWARLSGGAERYWPTFVYELAHETVHLLDPTIGLTNWFEEGIAVAFSIHAQERLQLPPQAPTTGPYADALRMVQQLPGNLFAGVKALRSDGFALRTVTREAIMKRFAGADERLVDRLVSQCKLSP